MQSREIHAKLRAHHSQHFASRPDILCNEESTHSLLGIIMRTMISKYRHGLQIRLSSRQIEVSDSLNPVFKIHSWVKINFGLVSDKRTTCTKQNPFIDFES